MATRPLRNAKTDTRLAYDKAMGTPVGLRGGSTKVNKATLVRTDTKVSTDTGKNIYKSVEKSQPNSMGGDDFISSSQKRVGSYAKNYFKKNSK